MTTATTSGPVMKPVIYADRCLGFILNRGRSGFETFNIDDRSLGIFPDERRAVAALFPRKTAGR
jgi:hypothetical protein